MTFQHENPAGQDLAFQTHTGDLFTSGFPAIGHGVNTEGAMASGIAVAFKNRFPVMHDEYMRLCETDQFKPGTTWVAEEAGHVIFNIASQQKPGANATYELLRHGVCDALQQADKLHIEDLALPKIGCGVGGLEWEQVQDILRIEAHAHHVNLHVIIPPGHTP